MAGFTKKQLKSLIAEAYDKAINEYVNIIVGIAKDIYDSCIAQYYASYSPIVYKRHNHPEGYNLYQANSFELSYRPILFSQLILHLVFRYIYYFH